jgi:hypothetical protein
MPTTHCFVPILGRRIRVTQLTDGGDIGTTQITTDGFVTLTLSAQIEAGTEILQRNAAGILCVNELLAPNFKRFNVEIDFCGVNPSLVSYVANASEYADYAGDVAGFTIREGIITGAFGLELWTGVGGALFDETANGYFLLPYVHRGNLGDIKVDGENAATFQLTGAYTVGGNNWGVGPYAVVINDDSPGVPDVLPTAIDPFDHLLMIDTAVAPPASACAPAPIPVLA